MGIDGQGLNLLPALFFVPRSNSHGKRRSRFRWPSALPFGVTVSTAICTMNTHWVGAILLLGTGQIG